MNKIDCDICMDLCPLVKDGVASEASCAAVQLHLRECPACRAALGAPAAPPPPMNEKRVMSRLKRQLALVGLILLVVGTILGIVFTEGQNIFYNALLMPALGALGYFVLGKRVYWLPVGVFLGSCLFSTVNFLIAPLGTDSLPSIMYMGGVWGMVYAALCGFGILDAALFHFAFKRKEKTQ